VAKNADRRSRPPQKGSRLSRSDNLFSKESLAAFLASPAGQRISAKSKLRRKAIEDLRQQQNSGMVISMPLF
jgi:hypothetical protein